MGVERFKLGAGLIDGADRAFGGRVGFVKQRLLLDVAALARAFRRLLDAGKQIMRTNARALAGTGRQHLVCHQAAAVGRLAPPDAVVGLLGVALLPEVQSRQQHQTGRNHGQQRQLQTVNETSLHLGNALHPLLCSSTSVAMRDQCAGQEALKDKQLRTCKIRTFGDRRCQQNQGRLPEKIQ
jgi:hypothetical protein